VWQHYQTEAVFSFPACPQGKDSQLWRRPWPDPNLGTRNNFPISTGTVHQCIDSYL
jgi:hypothetical protein